MVLRYETRGRPVSSGSIGLDQALGGGLTRGAVTVVSGGPGAGKSALGLLCCAAAQRAGGEALYCDLEGAVLGSFVSRLGVETERLWVTRPRAGEEALAIAERVLGSGGVDVVVFDSVHALSARAELETSRPGVGAGERDRLLLSGTRRLARAAARGRAALVLVHRYALEPRIEPYAPARFASAWVDVRGLELSWGREGLQAACARVEVQRGPVRGAREVLWMGVSGVSTEDARGPRAPRAQGARA